MNPSQAAEYLADLERNVKEFRAGMAGEILPPQRSHEMTRRIKLLENADALTSGEN